LFVAVGTLLLVLGGIVWGLPRSRDAVAVLVAIVLAVGGVMVWANAFVTSMELYSEGFRVAGLWPRSWFWSDVERFYVYETRGIQVVGYFPTARYRSSHPIVRLVAALNLGTYSVPTLGMDATGQADLMNEWLRKYGAR
jgi:hypothetical protein